MSPRETPTDMVSRSIRLRAGLWERASERANREGRTMSDVIREALTVYAAGASPRVLEDLDTDADQ